MAGFVVMLGMVAFVLMLDARATLCTDQLLHVRLKPIVEGDSEQQNVVKV